jgi:hypothetical protein
MSMRVALNMASLSLVLAAIALAFLLDHPDIVTHFNSGENVQALLLSFPTRSSAEVYIFSSTLTFVLLGIYLLVLPEHHVRRTK